METSLSKWLQRPDKHKIKIKLIYKFWSDSYKVSGCGYYKVSCTKLF